jgi:hypothetical protein
MFTHPSFLGRATCLLTATIAFFLYLAGVSLADDSTSFTSLQSPQGWLKELKALPDSPGLSFPFDPPQGIKELKSFGVPDWGEIGEDHFGIDLIPYYGSDLRSGKRTQKLKVVAPTDGNIRGIWGFDSGESEGNKDICVILEINEHWSVILMFEPKSSPGRLVEEQVKSITVKAGQQVKKGDEIGYLVVGEGVNEQYPHVHYALMYKDVVEDRDVALSYFEILRDVVAVPNLHPSSIPETVWPWAPGSLTLPAGYWAAFFCPYEFSSERAKTIFDKVLSNSIYPCGSELGDCGCICIYEGACGE